MAQLNLPNKATTTLLVPLGAVVLVVVALIITVGLVSSYSSRASHERASNHVKTVANAYNHVLRSGEAYKQTAQNEKTSTLQLAKSSKEYSSAVEAYKSAVKSLSAERAFKNSDLKPNYDQFAAKNTKFVTESTTYDKILRVVHKMTLNCQESAVGELDTDNLAQLTTAYDAAVTPCTDAMTDLDKQGDTKAAELAQKALGYFRSMRANVVGMETAYKANNRIGFESEFKAFIAKSNAYRTGTDISAALVRQASLVSEINKLSDAIKANQK